tara:strand:+ start:8675 stop:9460 length:786 start_codon:yes stop_codon:yes gene_type:complete
MSKPEVLPCPFCGADPLERAIEPHTHSGPLKALGVPDHPGSHVIECGCGAGMIAEAKEAVRAMWNRRETYTYQEARSGVPEVAGYDVFESESGSHVLLLPKEMAKVRLRLSASATALIRLTDHERLQAEAERLQAAHAADKAILEQLYRQRDDYAMHNMAVRQCTGIPRSVGISEPVEGFEDRPQDLAPAMREMALIIEADKARIAAQQWLLEQCQQSLRENSETYVELDAYLRGDIDHSEVLAIKAEHEAALAQQGKEGE